MALPAVPTSELPRERMWHRGPEALSIPELLALILRTGTDRRSVVQLAGFLLEEWGSLARLATATPEELASFPGVGPAKAASILAALELARRVPAEPDAAVVRTADDLRDLLVPRIGFARSEQVLVVVLSNGHRILRIVPVAKGSVDSAPVPVREILNAVLRNDGRALVLSHNHPSGDPTPSQADRAATDRLAKAAALVGVRLLDHIVVANHRSHSVMVDGIDQ